MWMNKVDDFGPRSIQLQVPNANETIDVPTLIFTGDVGHTSIKVPLDDVFDRVSQSYKNDPEALHRFSYYLLLQAKSFAKDINLAEDAEIVNLAIED
jgi:hypothetical protein